MTFIRTPLRTGANGADRIRSSCGGERARSPSFSTMRRDWRLVSRAAAEAGGDQILYASYGNITRESKRRYYVTTGTGSRSACPRCLSSSLHDDLRRPAPATVLDGPAFVIAPANPRELRKHCFGPVRIPPALRCNRSILFGPNQTCPNHPHPTTSTQPTSSPDDRQVRTIARRALNSD